MSSYLTHILTYLLIALPATFFLTHYDVISAGYNTLLALVFIGCFYAILPDIDTPSSKVRQLLGKLLLSVVLASLLGFLAGIFDEKAVYLAVALNFFLYILWFMKHRGILHTPLAGLLFSVPLILLKPVYAAYAFLGFLTHLILDKIMADFGFA